MLPSLARSLSDRLLRIPPSTASPYYGGEHAFRCSAANASRSGEFNCDSPYELVEGTILGASHLFP